MKSQAWITTVGTVWTFGFSPAKKRTNPGMLPMPDFSPPNLGTVPTRIYAKDIREQLRKEACN